MLRAERRAKPRADGAGSLPPPPSLHVNDNDVGVSRCSPGVDVNLGSIATPSPTPPPDGEGRTATRQASQDSSGKRRKIEYWNDLSRYIGSTYANKLGKQYPWSNMAHAYLANLARVHSAWRVMALWDLYLAGSSRLALQTRYSVYGFTEEICRLLEDPRVRAIAEKHEAKLARGRYGSFVGPKEIMGRLAREAGI